MESSKNSLVEGVVPTTKMNLIFRQDNQPHVCLNMLATRLTETPLLFRDIDLSGCHHWTKVALLFRVDSWVIYTTWICLLDDGCLEQKNPDNILPNGGEKWWFTIVEKNTFLTHKIQHNQTLPTNHPSERVVFLVRKNNENLWCFFLNCLVFFWFGCLTFT